MVESMNKFRLYSLALILLCATMFSARMTVPAHAAGDTITLSGEIGGMYTVPDGITKVILDGVTAADFESGVKLPAGGEVVLADGTENVCGILAMGDLRVTGSGALLGGSGIYAMDGDLTLDLTGSVVLEGGQIAAFGGSVTVNSGTYRLQSLPEGGGGLIVSSKGDILFHGGDVKIYNDYIGVTATDGSVIVTDTALEISAPVSLMAARTIVLPEPVRGTVPIQTENDAAYIGFRDEAVNHIKLTAAEAESGADPGEPVIREGKSDAGDAVTLGARDPDAEVIAPKTDTGGSDAAMRWGPIAGGAGLIVLAAVLLLTKKRKNRSEHTKE